MFSKDYKTRCFGTHDGRCIQRFQNEVELSSYLVNINKSIPFLSNFEYVFQYEKELMKLSTVKNSSDLPSLSLSKLNSISTNVKDGIIRCSVGDVIKVRADLISNNGSPRTSGYDDVRGWMVDTINRTAAAQVVDLKNGSYDISFTCLWPSSKSQLKVGVAYPREYLYIAMVNHIKGITRYVAGEFRKGNQSEVTPCFSTPNIPWPCLCNLTAFNNASFYCGRPTDLTCLDLQGIVAIHSMDENFNKTKEEAELMNSMVRSAEDTLIQQELYLETDENKTRDALPSCRRVGPRATWLSPYPHWFLDFDHSWHNLFCSMHSFNETQLLKCFNNSKIMIFGDSNAERIHAHFNSKLKLDCHRNNNKSWNVHISCHRSDSTMELTFDPHENHLYLSGVVWDVYKEGGVVHHIDNLPPSGRHVVVVHYYLHTMGAHLSVVHNRLLLYKAAIIKALARNPSILFAFRGPHISQKEWEVGHSLIGDSQGVFYLSIVKDIFKDLIDNVVFLDGWGMSIAVENEKFHPTEDIPSLMVNLLISFSCEPDPLDE